MLRPNAASRAAARRRRSASTTRPWATSSAASSASLYLALHLAQYFEVPVEVIFSTHPDPVSEAPSVRMTMPIQAPGSRTTRSRRPPRGSDARYGRVVHAPTLTMPFSSRYSAATSSGSSCSMSTWALSLRMVSASRVAETEFRTSSIFGFFSRTSLLTTGAG